MPLERVAGGGGVHRVYEYCTALESKSKFTRLREVEGTLTRLASGMAGGLVSGVVYKGFCEARKCET